jgi:hypothetical protein
MVSPVASPTTASGAAAAVRTFGSPAPLGSFTSPTLRRPGGTSTQGGSTFTRSPGGTLSSTSPGGSVTVTAPPRIQAPPPPPPLGQQQAAPATAPFRSPRVGGGTDENNAWTGGTTMVGLSYPKTIMGYRPSKFSDRLKVEEMLKKGLDASQRLYLNAGAHVNGVDTLGLSDWTECIDNDFCNKGLEGTMSIYDHLHRQERKIHHYG